MNKEVMYLWSFAEAPQKARMENLGAFCEWCGMAIRDRGRGTGKKFCGDHCRAACDREAFRLGRKAIRARRYRQASISPTDTPAQRLAKFLAAAERVMKVVRQ